MIKGLFNPFKDAVNPYFFRIIIGVLTGDDLRHNFPLRITC